jgi:hypothetical protein
MPPVVSAAASAHGTYELAVLICPFATPARCNQLKHHAICVQDIGPGSRHRCFSHALFLRFYSVSPLDSWKHLRHSLMQTLARLLVSEFSLPIQHCVSL